MKEKFYKKKEYILSVILILLILIMLLVFFRPPKKDTSFHEPDYQISFLVHEEMNNALENMKKGADKAADDLNASVRFISLEQGASSSQRKNIEEEIKNRTQAIIISPDARVYDALQTLQVPLIFAKSKLKLNKPIPYIGCNNNKIGTSLADEIIRHGNFHKKIVIFAEKQQTDSTKVTMQRLQDDLKKVGNDVRVEYMEQVTKEPVYKILANQQIDVAVALGQKQLEEVAMAFQKLYKEEKKRDMEVYGTGNSKAIIRNIEEGIIVSTIIQDDFSIGYLSVQCAIQTINARTCEKHEDIRYAIIDKENMYSKENERLLFPLVR